MDQQPSHEAAATIATLQAEGPSDGESGGATVIALCPDLGATSPCQRPLACPFRGASKRALTPLFELWPATPFRVYLRKILRAEIDVAGLRSHRGKLAVNQFGGLADGLALPHGLAGHVASELGRAG